MSFPASYAMIALLPAQRGGATRWRFNADFVEEARVIELVGRERERQELTMALAGRGGMVLVSGEAGIGKSRLVAEVVSAETASGRPVVWARPEQVTRPGPFALVLDLVENIAARERGAVAEEAESLVAMLLEPSEGGPATRRIAARLRGLLAQVGDRPIAIFEDLHGADEASHAVIVHLARSAADDGRWLIGTYRGEEISVDEELDRFLAVVAKEHLAAEIALRPLDHESSKALAAAMLGEHAGKADWVAASGEGVPFFIEELAAAFARTGSSSAVPDSITRVVLARGQRLGPVARHVVSAAALCAGAIDPSVVALACEMDLSAVSRALTEAARAGIIADVEDRLVFRHGLVRDAFAADLVSVEAQSLHRSIAEAIETVHAGALGPHAKALARHWYAGRDRDRAFGYAMEAGERALAMAATGDARLAFELAVACRDTVAPETLMGLAEVGVREGDTTSARELFVRAADAFIAEDRRVDAARALGRIAWLHAVNRRDDDAFAELDRALDIAGAADEPVRAALLAQKGRLQRGGRDDERAEALNQAVEIANRAGDHATRCDALGAMAWDAYWKRRLEEAAALARDACAAALLAERAESIGRSHNNCALILTGAGRPLEAIEYLRVARDRLAESFGSFGVAFIDTTEAVIRFRMGEPANAARLVGRHELGWSHSRSTARMMQVWAEAHAGDAERARAVLDRATEDAGVTGDVREALASGLVEIAFAEMLLGMETSIRETSALAEDLSRFDWTRFPPDDEALGLALAGRAFALAGAHEQATAILTRLDELTTVFAVPYFEGLAHEIRGLVAGDSGAAGASFRDAAGSLSAMSNSVDRARCLRLAAEHADAEESVAMLREARTLAVESGSSLEAGRAEAALRARGIRPRAGRPRKSSDPNALSAREEEVTALVAAGATNADIAARLFLSERTVQDHVAHAIRKLGLSGRAGLAAWAAKRGLV